MEYQSFGRCQKPKGSNIKQVLRVMLVLAVSVWLIYQIKNTETKNYGSPTKFVAGCGDKLLGRKGILSRSDERTLPESRNVDSVGEVEESFGIMQSMHVVSDGAKEDKDEELDHINEQLGIEETNEVQSFHDENGVPPDSNEEDSSVFSKVSWLKKINIYEVTYNDVEMNLEGSSNATTADEENNVTTTHVDTSGLQSRNRWR